MDVECIIIHNFLIYVYIYPYIFGIFLMHNRIFLMFLYVFVLFLLLKPSIYLYCWHYIQLTVNIIRGIMHSLIHPPTRDTIFIKE